MARLVAGPGGPSGIVVSLSRGTHRTLRTARVAELGSPRPPIRSDHICLASVAKAFSGAAALAVVARGQLSLDDTIGRWLPDLPTPWSAVTLRQLLGHTSGIPDFSATEAFRTALMAGLQTPPRTEPC